MPGAPVEMDVNNPPFEMKRLNAWFSSISVGTVSQMAEVLRWIELRGGGSLPLEAGNFEQWDRGEPLILEIKEEYGRIVSVTVDW